MITSMFGRTRITVEIARLQGTVSALVSTIADHEARQRRFERFMYLVTGMASTAQITAIISLMGH